VEKRDRWRRFGNRGLVMVSPDSDFSSIASSSSIQSSASWTSRTVKLLRPGFDGISKPLGSYPSSSRLRCQLVDSGRPRLYAHLQITKHIKRYAYIDTTKLRISTCVHQVGYRLIAQERWVYQQRWYDGKGRVERQEQLVWTSATLEYSLELTHLQ
jgi:hypothetical protein